MDLDLQEHLLESWYGPPLLAGLGTLIVDVVLHTLFSTPEETAAYFAAKFLLATIASLTAGIAIESPLKSAVAAGVGFVVLSSLYYYYAVYTQSTVLTCCPYISPQIGGIPSNVLFNIRSYQVTLSVFGFMFVHFVALFISFLVVYAVADRS